MGAGEEVWVGCEAESEWLDDETDLVDSWRAYCLLGMDMLGVVVRAVDGAV